MDVVVAVDNGNVFIVYHAAFFWFYRSLLLSLVKYSSDNSCTAMRAVKKT